MTTVWEQVTTNARLVSLPAVYLRLKELLAQPDFSMADVAMIIGQDPALTTRLLRLVNSPYFGLAAKIDTVFRAVSMLGTRQVHDLALATSVANSFAGMPTGVMDMRTFWRRSIFCGLASRELAKAAGVQDSERLFVAGLLRDIGHLVMYQTVPEPCRESMLAAEQREQPLYLVERELIGIDYARVGGVLMRQWQLPNSLREATEFHIEPRRALEFPMDTYLVHLAALLVTAAETGQPFGTGALAPLDESWQITGLTSQHCLAVQAECTAEADQALDFFLPGSQAVNS
jgi:HD-like signal output (HDOD) protein